MRPSEAQRLFVLDPLPLPTYGYYAGHSLIARLYDDAMRTPPCSPTMGLLGKLASRGLVNSRALAQIISRAGKLFVVSYFTLFTSLHLLAIRYPSKTVGVVDQLYLLTPCKKVRATSTTV